MVQQMQGVPSAHEWRLPRHAAPNVADYDDVEKAMSRQSRQEPHGAYFDDNALLTETETEETEMEEHVEEIISRTDTVEEDIPYGTYGGGFTLNGTDASSIATLQGLFAATRWTPELLSAVLRLKMSNLEQAVDWILQHDNGPHANNDPNVLVAQLESSARTTAAAAAALGIHEEMALDRSDFNGNDAATAARVSSLRGPPLPQPQPQPPQELYTPGALQSMHRPRPSASAHNGMTAFMNSSTPNNAAVCNAAIAAMAGGKVNVTVSNVEESGGALHLPTQLPPSPYDTGMDMHAMSADVEAAAITGAEPVVNAPAAAAIAATQGLVQTASNTISSESANTAAALAALGLAFGIPIGLEGLAGGLEGLAGGLEGLAGGLEGLAGGLEGLAGFGLEGIALPGPLPGLASALTSGIPTSAAGIADAAAAIDIPNVNATVNLNVLPHHRLLAAAAAAAAAAQSGSYNAGAAPAGPSSSNITPVSVKFPNNPPGAQANDAVCGNERWTWFAIAMAIVAVIVLFWICSRLVIASG